MRRKIALFGAADPTIEGGFEDRDARDSWGHARVQWSDGRAAQGWLRAGEAMVFTNAVTAAVTLRLAANEGRPGACTPGALFGPDLAVQVGGQFIVGEGV